MRGRVNNASIRYAVERPLPEIRTEVGQDRDIRLFQLFNGANFGENAAMETSKTPLYGWHTAHGAKTIDFHGWSMPLWYPTGAISEHRSVLTHAGLFDTSHMSVLMLRGSGAYDLLQFCYTRDLRSVGGKRRAPLATGEALCGALLDEQGEVVDDVIVHKLGDHSYLLTVNAGMGEAVIRHLEANKRGLEVELTDLTGKTGKMDLQGPASAKVLLKILRKPRAVLEDMGYFDFKGHFDGSQQSADVFLIDGTSVLLSRTGYTGEFGFEIYVETARLMQAWQAVIEAGEEFGLVVCGLAARDSLRTGAVLPLSRQDIGPWPFINHPWHFALPFNEEQTAFTKSFLGDVVLSLRGTAEHTQPFVGFDPRKVSLTDPARVVDPEGKEIGVVLTCVSDMAIARFGEGIFSLASTNRPADFNPTGLSCGFIRARYRLEPGSVVQLKDNKRTIPVMIVDDIRPDRTARKSILEMI